MHFWRRFRAWLLGGTAAEPLPAPAPEPSRPRGVSRLAVAEAAATGSPVPNLWVVPQPFGATREAEGSMIAMDELSPDVARLYAQQAAGAFSEGLGFLGYPYLAELTQRSEYRHIAEKYALETTRKWIKITGDDPDRVDALEKAVQRLKVRDTIREAVQHDCFFGRAQILIDLGDRVNDREWSRPLALRPEKIRKGGLKRFRTIEPLWSYPGPYDASNPLSPDFYRPRSWQVQTTTVHATRVLTLVGREMPDLLKPAYSFGGLSLSQMAKPYVDNWLRARQSVSDLIHSFSTMVLSTDMSVVLQGGGYESLLTRAELFNKTRDNRGLMVVDKNQEELSNVSTPLSTLDKLQAQAQEQIASVTGIPLVVLLGVTPSGLNASSDGEIKTFYSTIHGYQERVLREPLETILKIIQLSEFGGIDESIEFDFVDLWELDEQAAAAIRKSDADVDVAYINAGVTSPEETRERIANDEGSPYYGVDLSAAAPDLDPGDDPLAGEEDLEDDDDPAMDAGEFREEDHPRRPDGKFGSGGGSGSGGGKEKAKEKPDAKPATAPKPKASQTHPRIAAILGEAGVAKLRALIADKNSTAKQIAEALAPVEASMKETTPTLRHDEKPTDEFWSRRRYTVDPEKPAAATVQEMRSHLVDVAKAYASANGGVGVKYQKRARILLGPPAAGKSTSAEEIARKFGYAIADGDDAKKTIPEFDDGVGASAVHEESSYIAADVLDKLMSEGANVILPLVGASPGSIRKRIAALQAEGYDVTVDLVDVNPDEAARRRAGRTLSKGRHIASSYALSIGDGPQKTYETLKAEYPNIGFGRIDGNGPPRSERYIEAINHPDASEGRSVF
jgi:uncharacterized protein